MLSGRRQSLLSRIDFALHVGEYGQSNSMGQANAQRLQNPQSNYKGISLAYPAVKTTQPPYVANPANTYIYYGSGLSQTSDFGSAVMSWVPYNATTNANHNLPVANQAFGIECGLSQCLLDRGINEIFFIKGGYGGTALCPDYGTSPAPGYWNNTNRETTMQFIYAKAISALRAFRPGKIPFPLCNIWWQGENDGYNAVPKDVYKSNLADCLSFIDKSYSRNQFIKSPIPWFIIKIKHRLDATEEPIRQALVEYCNETPNRYLIDLDAYPQKVQLTTSEAMPLAKGTPNSSGLNDDVHLSYIAMLAAGELITSKLIQIGRI